MEGQIKKAILNNVMFDGIFSGNDDILLDRLFSDGVITRPIYENIVKQKDPWTKFLSLISDMVCAAGCGVKLNNDAILRRLYIAMFKRVSLDKASITCAQFSSQVLPVLHAMPRDVLEDILLSLSCLGIICGDHIRAFRQIDYFHANDTLQAFLEDMLINIYDSGFKVVADTYEVISRHLGEHSDKINSCNQALLSITNVRTEPTPKDWERLFRVPDSYGHLQTKMHMLRNTFFEFTSKMNPDVILPKLLECQVLCENQLGKYSKPVSFTGKLHDRVVRNSIIVNKLLDTYTITVDKMDKFIDILLDSGHEDLASLLCP